MWVCVGIRERECVRVYVCIQESVGIREIVCVRVCAHTSGRSVCVCGGIRESVRVHACMHVCCPRFNRRLLAGQQSLCWGTEARSGFFTTRKPTDWLDFILPFSSSFKVFFRFLKVFWTQVICTDWGTKPVLHSQRSGQDRHAEIFTKMQPCALGPHHHEYISRTQNCTFS